MENPEEILHSLEEFAKLKPKDIPRELEEYLCFVAKTGDPVYQWSAVKSLFREKLISVITEFYESCPSVEIPPCPNVEMFNYDSMKNFILEKLDTFAAAPFTVQRICELLTTPRKEYNRIDKYMRALEKNILVVSTTEPGNRRNAENGEGIMNGIESEHIAEGNSNNDINVEEMDDSPTWPRVTQPEVNAYQNSENNITIETQSTPSRENVQETYISESPANDEAGTSSTESVITCRTTEQPYVSIEPVASENCTCPEEMIDNNVSVTITAIPAPVQKRRDSIEPVVTSDDNTCDTVVIRTEDAKSEVRETEIEKAEQTTVEEIAVTVISEVPEKDNLQHEVAQRGATVITEKGEAPTETSNESKRAVMAEANVDTVEKQEIEPVSPVIADQESEVAVESASNIAEEALSDKDTECVESPEEKASCTITKTEDNETTIINDQATTEAVVTRNESTIVLTDESATTSTDEFINDTKTSSESINCETHGKPETTDILTDSTESHIVTSIPDTIPEPPTTTASSENSDDKSREETPMEVDLDSENTTDTATTAPNTNSNNV